jgi:hypothetical protein
MVARCVLSICALFGWLVEEVRFLAMLRSCREGIALQEWTGRRRVLDCHFSSVFQSRDISVNEELSTSFMVAVLLDLTLAKR